MQHKLETFPLTKSIDFKYRVNTIQYQKRNKNFGEEGGRLWVNKVSKFWLRGQELVNTIVAERKRKEDVCF